MIFVDTSFWVGLTVRRDARHDEAAALLEAHSSEPLVTSNLVRGESFTYFRRKAGHEIAVAFLDGIQRSPRLAIVPMTSELEERAIAWLRTHDEREYSFVDATSFALMRSLKIRRALAFDGDFAAGGFTELRA